MEGTISIEYNDGTSAFWAEMSDEDLDKIADYIEKNFRRCDSIGG